MGRIRSSQLPKISTKGARWYGLVWMGSKIRFTSNSESGARFVYSLLRKFQSDFGSQTKRTTAEHFLYARAVVMFGCRGGTVVTVTGNNLDSVAAPRIIFTTVDTYYNGTNTTRTRKHYSEVSADGRFEKFRRFCYRNRRSTAGLEPTDELNFNNVIRRSAQLQ